VGREPGFQGRTFEEEENERERDRQRVAEKRMRQPESPAIATPEEAGRPVTRPASKSDHTPVRRKGGAMPKKKVAKRSGTRKYGPKASKKVERAMHEMKRGKLRSGGRHPPMSGERTSSG
jgi:hypothetical protein